MTKQLPPIPYAELQSILRPPSTGPSTTERPTTSAPPAAKGTSTRIPRSSPPPAPRAGPRAINPWGAARHPLAAAYSTMALNPTPCRQVSASARWPGQRQGRRRPLCLSSPVIFCISDPPLVLALPSAGRAGAVALRAITEASAGRPAAVRGQSAWASAPSVDRPSRTFRLGQRVPAPAPSDDCPNRTFRQGKPAVGWSERERVSRFPPQPQAPLAPTVHHPSSTCDPAIAGRAGAVPGRRVPESAPTAGRPSRTFRQGTLREAAAARRSRQQPITARSSLGKIGPLLQSNTV